MSPLAPKGVGGVTTGELLDAAMAQPLANVFCLFASLCEAAEVQRRSVAFDFLSLGYALLAAGARTVVVPTMTVTAASDLLVEDALAALRRDPDRSVGAAWRAALAPRLARWRDEPDAGFAERVEASRREGEPTPVDLAAFVIMQSAGKR
jgi:hypothetical protein